MASSFRLEGSSMLPVFRPGQCAIVLSARPAAGDCAVYEYEGRTLLHRVLKTGPEGVWFADDAGRLKPHLITWEKVRGKVSSGHPLSGGLCGRLYSGFRRFMAPLFI